MLFSNYLYSIILIVLLSLIITGHIACHVLTKKNMLHYLFGYIVYFIDELFRMIFRVFDNPISAQTVTVIQLCVGLLMTTWLFFLIKAKSGKKIAAAEVVMVSAVLIGSIISHIFYGENMLLLLIYLWAPVTMYSVRNRDIESKIFFYTSIVMALLKSVNCVLFLVSKNPRSFYEISIWSELLLYCYIFIGITDVYLQMKQHAKSVKGLSSDQKIQVIVCKYGLSPREQEVLHLLLAGKSNAKIGEELFISEGTVKAHVHSIYQKLGVNSRNMLFTVMENIK